jgi:lysozyme
LSVIATPMFNIMAGNRKTHTTRRNVYRKASGERSARSRQGKTGSGFIRKLVRRYPRWAWWAGGLCVSVFYAWIFYYFFVGPFGFRWRALYGDAKYPEGYEIHGIDISHHQGDIDWELLRNAMIEKCPIRFILIKATEGTSILDSKFRENFTQAREYGFIRGAYHFWSNKSSAREQAYFFLDNVILIDGDLPPVLDVENKPKDVSVEDFQREILTWLHIVEDRYHVKPIIYTYYKFKMNYLNAPVFDDYPYWIAHYYVDKVEYAGEWKFWQHTDAGRLPGIKGYVDFNIYNGSYYDLHKFTIGN